MLRFLHVAAPSLPRLQAANITLITGLRGFVMDSSHMGNQSTERFKLIF